MIPLKKVLTLLDGVYKDLLAIHDRLSPVTEKSQPSITIPEKLTTVSTTTTMKPNTATTSSTTTTTTMKSSTIFDTTETTRFESGEKGRGKTYPLPTEEPDTDTSESGYNGFGRTATLPKV